MPPASTVTAPSMAPNGPSVAPCPGANPATAVAPLFTTKPPVNEFAAMNVTLPDATSTPPEPEMVCETVAGPVYVSFEPLPSAAAADASAGGSETFAPSPSLTAPIVATAPLMTTAFVEAAAPVSFTNTICPIVTFSSMVRTGLSPVTLMRIVAAASSIGSPPVNSLQLRFWSSVHSVGTSTSACTSYTP